MNLRNWVTKLNYNILLYGTYYLDAVEHQSRNTNYRSHVKLPHWPSNENEQDPWYSMIPYTHYNTNYNFLSAKRCILRFVLFWFSYFQFMDGGYSPIHGKQQCYRWLKSKVRWKHHQKWDEIEISEILCRIPIFLAMIQDLIMCKYRNMQKTDKNWHIFARARPKLHFPHILKTVRRKARKFLHFFVQTA